MKKSRVFKISVSILLVVCLLFLATWILSSMVMYPKSRCNPDHHVYCKDPGELGLEFEDIDLNTKDKLTLKAWYIPVSHSDRGIVFVHGHGGTKNEGLRFASALHKAGYHLLAFDMRAIGDGPLNFASMGYHEQKDVRAAIDYMIEQKKLRSIGIFGFSMGAATSIIYMAHDKRIGAGVFSSGYASAVDVIAQGAQRDFSLPKFPMVSLGVALANLRGHMDLNRVLPEEKIALIAPRAVFLMHCDKDDYVEYSHARRLFAAAQEPKELWTPVCNQHEYIWNTNKIIAEKKVVDFFKLNM